MIGTKSCTNCFGDGSHAGWVCESHAAKSWPDQCDCGPGMPCRDCYPSDELPNTECDDVLALVDDYD